MSRNVPPLILTVFPNFDVGGPQVRFALIANHFGAAYRHAIISMNGSLDCAGRLSSDLDVIFPTVEARRNSTLANAVQFRRVLKELRPDLLVTNNWGSIEWAAANFLPLVRHVHIEDGFGPEEQSNQLLRRILARRALLRHCTVVLPSRTLWRIAVEQWRLPLQRLIHVPNGIDLAPYAGVARERFDNSEVTVGTVAALRPEKNLSRLLRSFRIASQSCNARLVIVGDGPERPYLETLARELGLAGRVQFVGYVANPSQLYFTFDIFALSSDTEQMPFAVLEAMAAGLPVVATDVGDVREMLGWENESFVVPVDEVSLAERMLELLSNAPLRSRVGITNRAKVECSYSEQAMFRAYRELFDKDDGQSSQSSSSSHDLKIPEFRSGHDAPRIRK
ncbi:glycosyltransferase family 4 protein [Roseomonas xinghualingensis]|uniref:glycosyltransferase family 4 protein n=1 Tax=Roseomonas xinghualingensis TaxID=2986475 RepID=UPI0021F1C42A|nr:glycosyltransferase family 4 protein [Roseomonas sp. SXEYE001]MCV4208320.1 glycosyltransferase family 4 protein [Roseomonas sp. SXEYE001]